MARVMKFETTKIQDIYWIQTFTLERAEECIADLLYRQEFPWPEWPELALLCEKATDTDMKTATMKAMARGDTDVATILNRYVSNTFEGVGETTTDDGDTVWSLEVENAGPRGEFVKMLQEPARRLRSGAVDLDILWEKVQASAGRLDNNTAITADHPWPKWHQRISREAARDLTSPTGHLLSLVKASTIPKTQPLPYGRFFLQFGPSYEKFMRYLWRLDEMATKTEDKEYYYRETLESVTDDYWHSFCGEYLPKVMDQRHILADYAQSRQSGGHPASSSGVNEEYIVASSNRGLLRLLTLSPLSVASSIAVERVSTMRRLIGEATNMAEPAMILAVHMYAHWYVTKPHDWNATEITGLRRVEIDTTTRAARQRLGANRLRWPFKLINIVQRRPESFFHVLRLYGVTDEQLEHLRQLALSDCRTMLGGRTDSSFQPTRLRDRNEATITIHRSDFWTFVNDDDTLKATICDSPFILVGDNADEGMQEIDVFDPENVTGVKTADRGLRLWQSDGTYTAFPTDNQWHMVLLSNYLWINNIDLFAEPTGRGRSEAAFNLMRYVLRSPSGPLSYWEARFFLFCCFLWRRVGKGEGVYRELGVKVTDLFYDRLLGKGFHATANGTDDSIEEASLAADLISLETNTADVADVFFAVKLLEYLHDKLIDSLKQLEQAATTRDGVEAAYDNAVHLVQYVDRMAPTIEGFAKLSKMSRGSRFAGLARQIAQLYANLLRVYNGVLQALSQRPISERDNLITRGLDTIKAIGERFVQLESKPLELPVRGDIISRIGNYLQYGVDGLQLLAKTVLGDAAEPPEVRRKARVILGGLAKLMEKAYRLWEQFNESYGAWTDEQRRRFVDLHKRHQHAKDLDAFDRLSKDVHAALEGGDLPATFVQALQSLADEIDQKLRELQQRKQERPAPVASSSNISPAVVMVPTVAPGRVKEMTDKITDGLRRYDAAIQAGDDFASYGGVKGFVGAVRRALSEYEGFWKTEGSRPEYDVARRECQQLASVVAEHLDAFEALLGKILGFENQLRAMDTAIDVDWSSQPKVASPTDSWNANDEKAKIQQIGSDLAVLEAGDLPAYVQRMIRELRHNVDFMDSFIDTYERQRSFEQYRNAEGLSFYRRLARGSGERRRRDEEEAQRQREAEEVEKQRQRQADEETLRERKGGASKSLHEYYKKLDRVIKKAEMSGVEGARALVKEVQESVETLFANSGTDQQAEARFLAKLKQAEEKVELLDLRQAFAAFIGGSDYDQALFEAVQKDLTAFEQKDLPEAVKKDLEVLKTNVQKFSSRREKLRLLEGKLDTAVGVIKEVEKSFSQAGMLDALNLGVLGEQEVANGSIIAKLQKTLQVKNLANVNATMAHRLLSRAEENVLRIGTLREGAQAAEERRRQEERLQREAQEAEELRQREEEERLQRELDTLEDWLKDATRQAEEVVTALRTGVNPQNFVVRETRRYVGNVASVRIQEILTHLGAGAEVGRKYGQLVANVMALCTQVETLVTNKVEEVKQTLRVMVDKATQGNVTDADYETARKATDATFNLLKELYVDDETVLTDFGSLSNDALRTIVLAKEAKERRQKAGEAELAKMWDNMQDIIVRCQQIVAELPQTHSLQGFDIQETRAYVSDVTSGRGSELRTKLNLDKTALSNWSNLIADATAAYLSVLDKARGEVNTIQQQLQQIADEAVSPNPQADFAALAERANNLIGLARSLLEEMGDRYAAKDRGEFDSFASAALQQITSAEVDARQRREAEEAAAKELDGYLAQFKNLQDEIKAAQADIEATGHVSAAATGRWLSNGVWKELGGVDVGLRTLIERYPRYPVAKDAGAKVSEITEAMPAAKKIAENVRVYIDGRVQEYNTHVRKLQEVAEGKFTLDEAQVLIDAAKDDMSELFEELSLSKGQRKQFEGDLKAAEKTAQKRRRAAEEATLARHKVLEIEVGAIDAELRAIATEANDAMASFNDTSAPKPFNLPDMLQRIGEASLRINKLRAESGTKLAQSQDSVVDAMTACNTLLDAALQRLSELKSELRGIATTTGTDTNFDAAQNRVNIIGELIRQLLVYTGADDDDGGASSDTLVANALGVIQAQRELRHQQEQQEQQERQQEEEAKLRRQVTAQKQTELTETMQQIQNVGDEFVEATKSFAKTRSLQGFDISQAHRRLKALTTQRDQLRLELSAVADVLADIDIQKAHNGLYKAVEAELYEAMIGLRVTVDGTTDVDALKRRVSGINTWSRQLLAELGTDDTDQTNAVRSQCQQVAQRATDVLEMIDTQRRLLTELENTKQQLQDIIANVNVVATNFRGDHDLRGFDLLANKATIENVSNKGSTILSQLGAVCQKISCRSVVGDNSLSLSKAASAALMACYDVTKVVNDEYLAVTRTLRSYVSESAKEDFDFGAAQQYLNDNVGWVTQALRGIDAERDMYASFETLLAEAQEAATKAATDHIERERLKAEEETRRLLEQELQTRLAAWRRTWELSQQQVSNANSAVIQDLTHQLKRERDEFDTTRSALQGVWQSYLDTTSTADLLRPPSLDPKFLKALQALVAGQRHTAAALQPLPSLPVEYQRDLEKYPNHPGLMALAREHAEATVANDTQRTTRDQLKAELQRQRNEQRNQLDADTQRNEEVVTKFTSTINQRRVDYLRSKTSMLVVIYQTSQTSGVAPNANEVGVLKQEIESMAKLLPPSLADVANETFRTITDAEEAMGIAHDDLYTQAVGKVQTLVTSYQARIDALKAWQRSLAAWSDGITQQVDGALASETLLVWDGSAQNLESEATKLTELRTTILRNMATQALEVAQTAGEANDAWKQLEDVITEANATIDKLVGNRPPLQVDDMATRYDTDTLTSEWATIEKVIQARLGDIPPLADKIDNIQQQSINAYTALVAQRQEVSNEVTNATQILTALQALTTLPATRVQPQAAADDISKRWQAAFQNFDNFLAALRFDVSGSNASVTLQEALATMKADIRRYVDQPMQGSIATLEQLEANVEAHLNRLQRAATAASEFDTLRREIDQAAASWAVETRDVASSVHSDTQQWTDEIGDTITKTPNRAECEQMLTALAGGRKMLRNMLDEHAAKLQAEVTTLRNSIDTLQRGWQDVSAVDKLANECRVAVDRIASDGDVTSVASDVTKQFDELERRVANVIDALSKNALDRMNDALAALRKCRKDLKTDVADKKAALNTIGSEIASLGSMANASWGVSQTRVHALVANAEGLVRDHNVLLQRLADALVAFERAATEHEQTTRTKQHIALEDFRSAAADTTVADRLDSVLREAGEFNTLYSKGKVIALLRTQDGADGYQTSVDLAVRELAAWDAKLTSLQDAFTTDVDALRPDIDADYELDGTQLFAAIEKYQTVVADYVGQRDDILRERQTAITAAQRKVAAQEAAWKAELDRLVFHQFDAEHQQQQQVFATKQAFVAPAAAEPADVVNALQLDVGGATTRFYTKQHALLMQASRQISDMADAVSQRGAAFLQRLDKTQSRAVMEACRNEFAALDADLTAAVADIDTLAAKVTAQTRSSSTNDVDAGEVFEDGADTQKHLTNLHGQQVGVATAIAQWRNDTSQRLAEWQVAIEDDEHRQEVSAALDGLRIQLDGVDDIIQRAQTKTRPSPKDYDTLPTWGDIDSVTRSVDAFIRSVGANVVGDPAWVAAVDTAQQHTKRMKDAVQAMIFWLRDLCQQTVDKVVNKNNAIQLQAVGIYDSVNAQRPAAVAGVVQPVAECVETDIDAVERTLDDYIPDIDDQHQQWIDSPVLQTPPTLVVAETTGQKLAKKHATSVNLADADDVEQWLTTIQAEANSARANHVVIAGINTTSEQISALSARRLQFILLQADTVKNVVASNMGVVTTLQGEITNTQACYNERTQWLANATQAKAEIAKLDAKWMTNYNTLSQVEQGWQRLFQRLDATGRNGNLRLGVQLKGGRPSDVVTQLEQLIADIDNERTTLTDDITKLNDAITQCQRYNTVANVMSLQQKVTLYMARFNSQASQRTSLLAAAMRIAQRFDDVIASGKRLVDDIKQRHRDHEAQKVKDAADRAEAARLAREAQEAQEAADRAEAARLAREAQKAKDAKDADDRARRERDEIAASVPPFVSPADSDDDGSDDDNYRKKASRQRRGGMPSVMKRLSSF